MKKLIVKAILTAVTVVTASVMVAGCVEKESKERETKVCTYHDYLVVTTPTGNDFEIEPSIESRYIKDGKIRFEEGDKVEILFDTNGTETEKDDKIVNMKLLL